MSTPAQLINRTSGTQEYWTPHFITYRVREFFGVIHLDPASSQSANEWVQAREIYTRVEDGLRQRWYGNVWMNHPFGRRENPLWVSKLMGEYMRKHLVEAICITYACTSESWFQPLLQRLQCFLIPRTNYYLPDGSLKRGVTKGSVLTYLGERPDEFRNTFSDLGVVK